MEGSAGRLEVACSEEQENLETLIESLNRVRNSDREHVDVRIAAVLGAVDVCGEVATLLVNGNDAPAATEDETPLSDLVPVTGNGRQFIKIVWPNDVTYSSRYAFGPRLTEAKVSSASFEGEDGLTESQRLQSLSTEASLG